MKVYFKLKIHLVEQERAFFRREHGDAYTLSSDTSVYFIFQLRAGFQQ